MSDSEEKTLSLPSPPEESQVETMLEEIRTNFKPRPIPPLTAENMSQRVHVEYNEDSGFWEGYDILTGKLVTCENEAQGPWDLKKMIPVEIDGEKVLVPRGADFSRLTSGKRIHYSPEIVQLMCNDIASGESLTKVCAKPHFPSTSLLSRWRKEMPEITDALLHAYEMRAELARDKVQEVADKPASSKIELENQKKQIDGYKWLARSDAPSRFGSSKVDVDQGGDMVINIISAIDRSPREREVVDVSKEQVSDGGGQGRAIGGDSGSGVGDE